MKKKAMRRRIRHLEQRLFQELPVLQLENDLLRASKSLPASLLLDHYPGRSFEFVAREQNISRGGYPGYYPDPQTDPQ